MEKGDSSSKFRIVVQLPSGAAGPAPDGNAAPPPQNGVPTAVDPPLVAPPLATIPVNTSSSVIALGGGPRCAASALPPRRYGGAFAIVKGKGSVDLSSVFSVEPGKSRADRAVCKNDAVVLSSVKPPITSGQSKDVSSHVLLSPLRDAGDMPQSTRRGGDRAGTKRGRTSGGRSSSSRTSTSLRGRSRGRISGGSLPLQPNGAPYSHTWSTVNGRRLLHYNGVTYSGRKAHAFWRQIKEKSSSTPSNGVSGSFSTAVRESPTTVCAKPKKVSLRAGKLPIARKVDSESLPKPSRGAVSQCASTGFVTVKGRRSLLLDDDEGDHETQPPSKKDTRVVIDVSDSCDSVCCDSEASLLSSWSSLQTCSDLPDVEEELLPNTTVSGGDEDGNGRKKGGRHVTNSLGNETSSNYGEKLSSDDFVEHDGFLYPAELFRECFRKNAEEANARPGKKRVQCSAPLQGCVEVTDVAEEPCEVQGVQVLGVADWRVAPAPTNVQDAVRAPYHVNGYMERYEDMDVIPSVAEAGAEDLFVVGDEIGGMRFAG
uniref:WGS project CAEQ00000000 data, annotated contig 2194 n=1 Tax=Trypanosoma congolense (strain IL3000) TaxID=1068625 RepID=F9WC79_TRYCI|nr:unnamed protein product [Trypanosoma congolense IL3000]